MAEYFPKYLDMHTETARLTVQFIRNYDRFVEQADDLLSLGVGIKTDSQPRGTSTGDPTARTAEQREKLLAEIKIIDDSLSTIPKEYQAVIWEWVKEARPLYSIGASLYASDRTWYEYKRRFITEVAKRKGWMINEID